MPRLVEVRGDYKIIFSGRGRKKYTVAAISNNEDKHGHFSKLSDCYKIINMVYKKEVPKKNKEIISAIRLTLDDKYRKRLEIKLEKNKNRQRYFNPQKGLKRVC